MHETAAAHPYRTPAPHDDPPALSVPYGGETRMRLSITSGLSSARIRVDPGAAELVAIDPGDGPPPRLRVSGSEIRVAWSLSITEWLRSALTLAREELDVVLHPKVAWDLALRGGMSSVEADLSAGAVTRIDAAGGASHVTLVLPRPEHDVPIRIAGGASHVQIRRPADVRVRVAVHGGLSSVRLDDRFFEAAGGHTRLATDGSVPQYDVTVHGGASHIEVDPA